MALSVFDMFKVGIGPSSSHTVGPMVAARRFVQGLETDGLLGATCEVSAELFGSLGATGHGHGSNKAVILGLEGEEPETVNVDSVDDRLAAVRRAGRLRLLGVRPIDFDLDTHLALHRRTSLPLHPNGMRFTARDRTGAQVRARTYYSVGGGFVVDESATGPQRAKPDETPVPYAFRTGAELLAHCAATGLPMSGVMLANELAWRSEGEVPCDCSISGA